MDPVTYPLGEIAAKGSIVVGGILHFEQHVIQLVRPHDPAGREDLMRACHARANVAPKLADDRLVAREDEKAIRSRRYSSVYTGVGAERYEAVSVWSWVKKIAPAR